MGKQYFLFIVIAIPVLMVLHGCRSVVQYVPIETVRTDTVYLSRNSTISVVIKDSLVIDRTRDTVKVVQNRYVGEHIIRCDTVYVSRTDSIQIPYPVEKKLGRWEQTKVYYGGYAMAITAVAIFVFVGWMLYKIWRR